MQPLLLVSESVFQIGPFVPCFRFHVCACACMCERVHVCVRVRARDKSCPARQLMLVLSRVRLCATPWAITHQASVHGILQVRILEWVASHSLLQGVFPTQESSPGLLHCRKILYLV